ncbi:MAG TPA: FGGY family carbohydrate kinase, partial [Puia sp.]|nr:FGGY family carbohydrate kinase [Puia sp.]
MQNVIAIFDVGKTNKKLFLFDEEYRIVWEHAEVCDQTVDEDGEPCEDIVLLTDWVRRSFARVAALPGFNIKAVNFSAYGASLVYIGYDGTPVAPLYNYLKPFPDDLRRRFYDTYGGEITFSMLSASPVLGSLNSGMQLYRIRQQQPELFASIRTALHLPQYISYLFTGSAYSDITSIGCHTNLWNFSQQHYHEWVYREGIIDKLAPILPSTSVIPLKPPPDPQVPLAGAAPIHGPTWPDIPLAGIGIHDSSAALIPYLTGFREPFALISTGTWCITLNPFNDAPLTAAELQQDCLCYMSYRGTPVKASRLFAGYEHEQQVQRLSAHFHKDPGYALTVAYDADCAAML